MKTITVEIALLEILGRSNRHHRQLHKVASSSTIKINTPFIYNLDG